MSHHTSPSGRLRPWEPDSVPAWKQSTAFDRVQAGPALTGLSVLLSPEFVSSVWKNNTELEGISMQGTEQTSKEDNCTQHFVCLCSKLRKPNYYLIFRWSPPFLYTWQTTFAFCLNVCSLSPKAFLRLVLFMYLSSHHWPTSLHLLLGYETEFLFN